MVTMACNGMDHRTAIAIGAMDLQCLGLGGSYIDGVEPALTQRGLLQKPFCKGEGIKAKEEVVTLISPHHLAAQASALPHLHPQRKICEEPPEYSSISGPSGVDVGAVGGRWQMRRRSSGSRWIRKKPYRLFEISDSSALVLA